MFTTILLIIMAVLFILAKMTVLVEQRESVIVERLGKYKATLSPGLHFLIPFVDNAAYSVEIREQVLDVPPQQCITKDNVQVIVDGLVYLKVTDPYNSSYGIADYRRAAVDLAQTTMRSEIGKMDLDETFKERETLNERIISEIDKASESWGIKVLRYEIKNITPSREQIDTMEKQMEAERQKRATIIRTDGERTATILVSEGERQSAINVSEGERQAAINQSEGKKIEEINYGKARSEEIKLISNAIAQGIEKVSESVQESGGDKALRYHLVDGYIKELGKVLKETQLTIIPADLGKLGGLFEGLKSTVQTKGGEN